MEDKTFELLTKMYSEFSGRFDGVENRLKKVESLIENDVKKDISVLYDGYKQTYEEVVDIKKAVKPPINCRYSLLADFAPVRCDNVLSYKAMKYFKIKI